MDLELKEFEQKINSITEQFMSLLDSDVNVDESVQNNMGSIKNEPNNSGPVFRVGTDTINFGDVGYNLGKVDLDNVPKHAIKFDSAEEFEINKKLEGLYIDKRDGIEEFLNTKSSIAFSDSNIGRINGSNISQIYASYDKYEADSTLKNKEVTKMGGYNFNEAKDYVLETFATIPEERALVAKRGWKETLFMDIPWDTKIDIWGGFKKLCNTQVKFTF